MRRLLLILILLLLLALLWLLPARSDAAYPCGYGWPGSAYWYCVRNDQGLQVRTSSDQAGTTLEVCDFTGRYTGQWLVIQPLWVERWTWERRTPAGPALRFTPSPDQPCLHVRLGLPPEGMELDTMRAYSLWFPMAVQGLSL